MIAEALSQPFFQRALLAAILVGIASGVVGSFVVVKRMSSISGGLSHAAFGGIGLGYLCNFSPLLGAVIFCVVCAALIGQVYLRQRQGLDTLISLMWSTGMALGILFIALKPGYAPDLTSYLFGSILFVPSTYIWAALVLDIVVLVCLKCFFKELHAVSFDEEYATVSGVHVEGIFHLLLLLVALTVVVLIRVVGVVLTIALLATPAVIAQHWVRSLKKMFVVSSGIAVTCSVGGLFLSYILSEQFGFTSPTGALIILLCTACYLFSIAFKATFPR